jgi:hypothetical protein
MEKSHEMEKTITTENKTSTNKTIDVKKHFRLHKMLLKNV